MLRRNRQLVAFAVSHTDLQSESSFATRPLDRVRPRSPSATIDQFYKRIATWIDLAPGRPVVTLLSS